MKLLSRSSNGIDKKLIEEAAGFVDVYFTNIMIKRIAINCDVDYEIVEDVDGKDVVKDQIVETF